jgi:hypothetical protein
VSQPPAEPRVLILRAIDAAAADRHARLGHPGDWRAPGGCDCLVKVQPIVSAGLYQAAMVSRHQGWDEELFRLRDLWRTLLTSPYLPITNNVLAKAAAQAGADPARLATTLDDLARRYTLDEVLAEVAAAIGTEPSQLTLSRGRVQRGRRI